MTDSGPSKVILVGCAAATAAAAAAAYMGWFSPTKQDNPAVCAQERSVQTGESLMRGGGPRGEDRLEAIRRPQQRPPKQDACSVSSDIELESEKARKKRIQDQADQMLQDSEAEDIDQATVQDSRKLMEAKAESRSPNSQKRMSAQKKAEKEAASVEADYAAFRQAAEQKVSEQQKASQKVSDQKVAANTGVTKNVVKQAADISTANTSLAAAAKAKAKKAAASEKVAAAVEKAAAAKKATAENVAAAEQAAAKKAMTTRKADLRTVFELFDLNGSGSLSKDELFLLGQKRRQLGQIGGTWTQEQNEKLLSKMNVSGNGKLSPSEFCDWFAEHLPMDEAEFKTNIGQFTQVANDCRAEKQREAAAKLVAAAVPDTAADQRWKWLSADQLKVLASEDVDAMKAMLSQCSQNIEMLPKNTKAEKKQRKVLEQQYQELNEAVQEQVAILFLNDY